MTDRFEVAVLGTGLFGAALVYHLARELGSRVLALGVDRPRWGPSSTATSAGILSVQGWDSWDLSVVRESAEEYYLLAESEGGLPLRRNGGLRVARTPEGERWLGRVRSELERERVEVRSVGPSEVQDLLPFADLAEVRTGLHTPEDATLSAADLQALYMRGARRRGAVVRASQDGFTVTRRGDGLWRLDGEAPVDAESLVVAAGAWSKPILARLGHALPLAPFRAQALELRPRPLLGPFPTLHDLDLGLYVRPGSRGCLVAGDGTGTREENPFDWDPTADPEFVSMTSQTLTELFGGLRSLRAEAAWAGLCAASPDRFPLVGRVRGAERLFVASGFNGFGTMRAGSLARRLAEGILSERWDALLPADPGRFPDPVRPFEPRPEFPLEGEEVARSLTALEGGSSARFRAPNPFDPPANLSFRTVEDLAGVDRLRWAPLSEWFDPFLPLFAKDSIRTGGRVEVAMEDETVRGLLLAGSSEEVSSGFTRHRSVATRYLERPGPLGIYLEEPWAAGGEPVELFAADVRDWTTAERWRNSVRIARREDLPGIRLLMRGELGPGVDAWFATLPRPEETAFLCEVRGQVVGVSWLTRAGAFARGHSFVVHPRFRGLGIGSDLLTARMLWLQRTGGRSVVSEIYGGNLASRTAAERAGMALVARMFHFRPARP